MAGKSTILRQVGLIVAAGAGGELRARGVGDDRRVRSRVHARRCERQPRARTIHVHGGDGGDERHPAHGDAPEPRAARRDRPRHEHVRRRVDRVGGERAPAQRVGCKTIFATHYHELVQLADELAAVRNYNVGVREVGDQVLFLHRLQPGGADRSYGIEVGKLAGLPEPVIARAREVLATARGGSRAPRADARVGQPRHAGRDKRRAARRHRSISSRSSRRRAASGRRAAPRDRREHADTARGAAAAGRARRPRARH